MDMGKMDLGKTAKKGKPFVSASQVGCLLGHHPHVTEKDLWDYWTAGKPLGFTPSLEVEAGKTIEPFIMEMVRQCYGIEFGGKIEGRESVNFHGHDRYFSECGCLAATPDGITGRLRPDSEYPFMREFIIRCLASKGAGCVEIKSQWYKNRWGTKDNPDPPEHYIWQVMAQMAVTGLSWAILVWMDFPNPEPNFTIYEARKETENINRVLNASRKFIESITAGDRQTQFQ